MNTVYSVKNLETGLYRNKGSWAEEPEWMTWSSAQNVAEAAYLIGAPIEIKAYKPTHEDIEQDADGYRAGDINPDEPYTCL